MTHTTTETVAASTDTAVPPSIHPVTPAVAIHEDADGYTVEAEMPGVNKNGVHVRVENGELVLTGTKAPCPAGTRLHAEASRADYRRVFDLDPAVETERITARLEQGVLVLRLPKAPDRKARRIEVTG
jgi:HSP20 family protein